MVLWTTVEIRGDRHPYGLCLYHALGSRDRPGCNMFTRKNDGFLPICVRPPRPPVLDDFFETDSDGKPIGDISLVSG